MFSLCSLEVDRSESKGTTNSTSAYLDMSNHRDTADSFDSKPFLILMREPLNLMFDALFVMLNVSEWITCKEDGEGGLMTALRMEMLQIQ